MCQVVQKALVDALVGRPGTGRQWGESSGEAGGLGSPNGRTQLLTQPLTSCVTLEGSFPCPEPLSSSV